MNKKLVGLIVVFACFAMIFTVFSGYIEGKRVKKGTELIIGTPYEPDTLDVQKTTWVVESASIVYENLVQYDLNGKLKPGLAESWEISEDGKIITFHLREGIKFANGDPLTAEDVKYTIDRMLDPETKCPTTFMLGPIKSVKVIDNLTFQMIFKEPYAPIWAPLAETYVGIIDKDFIEKVGDTKYGETPMAAGPYYVIKWVRGNCIEYVKNPHYKGIYRPDYENEGAPYIDKIKLRIIPETLTLISELKAGNVQLIDTVPPEYYKKLQDNPKITVIPSMAQGITYLGFNCMKPPLDDVRVRQAIAMAVNRDPIIEDLLQGMGVATYGPLPPTIPGYSEEMDNYAKEKYLYDIEEAKALLSKAGWEDRDEDGVVDKDGKPLKLQLWNSMNWPQHQKIATVLQQQLAKIGVKIEVRTYEDAYMRSELAKGTQELFLWQYGWADPWILNIMFHSEAAKGAERMFFHTEELDEMLIEANSLMNFTKRAAVLKEIQKYLIDGCPWVPLFTELSVYAYRNDMVEGIKVNPYAGGELLLGDTERISG